MKKGSAIYISIFIFFLYGCATPYQKSGFWGDGYSETQIDKNAFKVSFIGNDATSGDRAYDFTLLRSAELALNHGFNYFVIIDSKNLDKHGILTTSTSAITYVQPGLTNIITCYKNKPANIFSYNAAYIQKNMSTKYKLS